MSGIGHNGGPSIEAGFGFRKLAWGKARKSLLKTLPIEIVRVRVARAKRLGIDYTTYASIRAASGHDVVAFLFSGNALEMTPRRLILPDHVTERLEGLEGAADRLAAIYAPAHPDALLSANPGLLDHAAPAPRFTESWSAMRDRIQGMVRERGLPADGVVLVSATAVEREWCAAGKLAGAIPADRFFAAAQPA
ncbi:hypothetical protein [Nioella sediminis]|jgi:hypothetical protein|uniref:hypothetical protein n=1 Tax=Nioella sediminis TaxID=1912092 RepID=UPI0008FD8F33|nr:hypothetical protein [Nioella sediminis]TBX20722.1 hypothetical protein TK43_13935 [Roseovarius sp. JS7-11]